MSERMPLFMTGWRYVATADEADALPQGALAIVDDEYLWDALDGTPSLTPGSWDGVVDVQERDFVHGCEYAKCTPETCHYEWLETGDSRGRARPPLPFFAWHPTFCSVSRLSGQVPTEEPR